MNLRPKRCVPKLYSFFPLFYSFLIVVQLSKNIDMLISKFVQLCKKDCTFGTNTIANEIKTKAQCTKAVQLFSFVVQLFKNIDMMY